MVDSAYYESIKNFPERSKEIVLEAEKDIRRHLNIPDDYEIFFGGSATQSMEQIMESLRLDIP